jgi:hypothetical protein
MSNSDTHTGRWPNLLLGAAVIGCAWLAAFAIETAARLSNQTLRHLGADVPVPYQLVIDFVRGYGPWIVAALITAVVIFLGLRRSARYLHVCIVSAVATTVMVSLSALALSLPMVMCSDFWPAWSGTAAAPGSAKLACRGLQ